MEENLWGQGKAIYDFSQRDDIRYLRGAWPIIRARL